MDKRSCTQNEKNKGREKSQSWTVRNPNNGDFKSGFHCKVFVSNENKP